MCSYTVHSEFLQIISREKKVDFSETLKEGHGFNKKRFEGIKTNYLFLVSVIYFNLKKICNLIFSNL